MSRLLMSTLAAALLGALAPAGAQGQAEQARRFVRNKHEAVMRLMRKEPSDSRSARLDGLIEDLIDYRELSKRALGERWDDRSKQEREQFVELLRKLVTQNYKRNLDRTSEYEVSYGEAEQDGGGVIVHTTARSKNNRRAPPVSIDYRLTRRDGQWHVYDVITDGVSMLGNYREQFDKIIDEHGWSGLIERMRSKLEE